MSGAVGPAERFRTADALRDEPDDVAAREGWTPVSRAAAYTLLVALAVLLALWGAFLVPFRVAGTLVPVSWAVALLGNVAVGRVAARIGGSAAVLPPALLWLLVAFTLASRRAEGDLVVPGTPVGLGFLLLGAVGSAVAYGAALLTPRG